MKNYKKPYLKLSHIESERNLCNLGPDAGNLSAPIEGGSSDYDDWDE